MYYVNKTEVLEKGIDAFPSLFIEGAAACGKTTVVNMFLEAHPEVHSDVFLMDKEAKDFTAFKARLDACSEITAKKSCIVFENINRELTTEFYQAIVKFILHMPDEMNAFLISREKLARELLELLWKGKMGMVFQNSLAFSASEVAELVSQRKSFLKADEVYLVTGGWPGCVSLILRLAEQLGAEHRDTKNAKSIWERYEVQEYIQGQILGSLATEEEEVMRRADLCPWINEEICEDVWEIMWPGTILKGLEQKGLLLYNEQKKRWKIAPMFQKVQKVAITSNLRKQLAKWYEEHGAVTEALWCLQDESCADECREYVIRHFDTMDFIGIQKSNISNLKGNIPELCYLRGMYGYLNQDFTALRKEMYKVQKLEGRLADEVYLNLAFVDPDISLEEWMTLLVEIGTQWAPIRLYHFTENAGVFSTGWRELSGLFIGSVAERKQRGQVLKELLGEKEWIGIQFAYADFVMETRQHDALNGPAWQHVLRVVNDEVDNLTWRYKVACLYLLSKMYVMCSEPEIGKQVEKLTEALQGEEDITCQKYLYAITRLHSLWHSEEDKATRWLYKSSGDISVEVNEANYYLLFLRAKGFILLNQYEQAQRILKKLIPYAQEYKRTRLMAELLFQQAVVQWAVGKKGAALRSAIESFLFTGDYRYVTFYMTYGKTGKEVLEAYIDWHQKNHPEKWNKKKKYNYGNVLYMPMEDYLGVVLRGAKRSARKYSADEEYEMVEKLTMMETMILQDINRGLSNSEICVELNLKLPTVKTHISNMYKKLGVNNRVQAILKGKELGIVK